VDISISVLDGRIVGARLLRVILTPNSAYRHHSDADVEVVQARWPVSFRPMNSNLLPAPFWRRLAAATYDGMLVLAIWMVIVALTVIIFSYAPLPRADRIQQAAMVLGTWFYFARSWTRGGQTLGMRAWRLGVRQVDGEGLTLTTATRRFMLMFVLCVLPLIIGGIAGYRYGWTSGPLPALILLPLFTMGALLIPGRRAVHDWLSRTEILLLPAVPSANR
jgi:uncharacterized RDD family membrane protein YckC